MQTDNVTFLSAPLTVEQRAALDALDELGTCWEAVTVLMAPSTEGLSDRDRDCVCVLMQRLQREYAEASAAFRKVAWHGLRPPPHP